MLEPGVRYCVHIEQAHSDPLEYSIVHKVVIKRVADDKIFMFVRDISITAVGGSFNGRRDENFFFYII